MSEIARQIREKQCEYRHYLVFTAKTNIVIVCLRDAGGAKRCYKHLKNHYVPEEKLAFLEKGLKGWPYTDTQPANSNCWTYFAVTL